MILTTWNMQGANHSTEVKWQTGVANMLANTTRHPSAICLQEAGGVPDSARLRISLPFPVPNGGGMTNIDIYDWGGTEANVGRKPPRTIVFHLWDVNGNRVNTGVVTRDTLQPGANVHLAWPAFGPIWRPAVGVQIGLEWIFSFHAISGGGGDAQGMLAAIAAFAGPATWRVGGDFNRAPGTLGPGVIPMNSVVCPPNDFTHPSSHAVSQLDYFVCRGTAVRQGSVNKSIYRSDHWSVDYDF